jgi:site-specific DNA recombinase
MGELLDIGRKSERETARLVDGIANPQVLGDRMEAIVAERRALETELAAAPPDRVVALHPSVVARKRALDELHVALQASPEAGDLDASAALRELIETVTVARDDSRRGGIKIVVTGRLNAILGESAYPNGVCSMVVAGAGIEPATYGL